MSAARFFIADQSPEILKKIEAILGRHGLADGVEFVCDPAQAAEIVRLGVYEGENSSGRRDMDYAKPVRIGVLIGDIERLVAQAAGAFEPKGWGPYVLDEIRRVLRIGDDVESGLTDRECDILRYLIAAQGHSVSREDLLRDVWGYREDLETHTLETHIYRLRQKIEANPNRPEFILTTESGYRLSS